MPDEPPDWSAHPVDILKYAAEWYDIEMTPERELDLRNICDARATMLDASETEPIESVKAFIESVLGPGD